SDPALFSPNGEVLAISDYRTGDLGLYEVASGRLFRRLSEGNDATRLAFSPDGKWLVTTSSADDVVRLWSTTTGRALGRLATGRGGGTQVCFSPDGKRLATAGEDTTALIWEVSALQGEAGGTATGGAR